MLALEPGRTVSADRLAEGLWGDRVPSSGPKMVQLYVSHLRRVFDGDGVRIVTRGRGYELQLADGDVDAVRAERLLEESRPREALALWRGEPLADLADEPFAADAIRRLVAASGRAGASVTVHVGVEERRRAGPYFVSLLNDLGFRARLRVFPAGVDYFGEVMRPDSRKQMGIFGWAADYMSASTLLDPLFACTARGDPTVENVSRVCTPRLEAAIGRARAAAPEDAPAAWAAVDRRIVKLAATVPYVNSRLTVFVSKRVGNVTSHPMYFTLLDQMWVR